MCVSNAAVVIRPSQFPPRHLAPHSAPSPKASNRHGRGASNSTVGHACSWDCEKDWHDAITGSLSPTAAPSYDRPSPLPSYSSTLRERLCTPNMSHSPCLWLADHVSSHARAPSSPTVPSPTASCLCVALVPRAGMSALVALIFRHTRARPACFTSSHVWAQNPRFNKHDGMQMQCDSLLLVDPTSHPSHSILRHMPTPSPLC
ncbi:hypothetical protein BDW02DRAFT_184271 [Decorospora gaudefroyi]|uniref:Uncharacterized protein n=1 Tax=Decorospora gaudefroyi TaxID=184978 RepID=A0A6A5JXT3_9PLEO|nr:hypothetical protein BDW02DRAFT_184271 [Decorospora gaudefroyi]